MSQAATMIASWTLIISAPGENGAVQPMVPIFQQKERELINNNISDGLSTCSDKSGSRMVAVSSSIRTLHKTKRVTTLTFLLDVIKKGKPNEALTAAGLAIALEDGPYVALVCAYFPPTLLDEPQGLLPESFRDRMIEWVEGYISQKSKQP